MTFKEFLQSGTLDVTYEPNPRNTLQEDPLISNSFEYVKDLLYTIDTTPDDVNTLIVTICIDRIKDRQDVYQMDVEDILDYIAYFNQEILEIVEMEKALQTVVPRPSIDTFVGQIGFEGFSYFPQVYDLTDGDVTKYKEVLELPYSVCYQYLIYKSKLNDLQYLIQKDSQNNVRR